MAKTCSECTHMNFEKEHDNDGKFWCEKKYEWMRPESAECWLYCTAYSRDRSVAESYRNYSKDKQSSSGCFITTILCKIIGLSDNNPYLEILRSFRKNYLQKNPNTIVILEEYDFIGPLISKGLENDENQQQVATHIFRQYIVPVIDDICSNNYASAITRYTTMTKMLIQKYNLQILELTIPSPNNYDYRKDYSQYGHGKIVKQKA